MKDIKILDCTLRDGGRIIDCKFSENISRGIIKLLVQSGIDIVEVGFLRDNVNEGESTFFQNVEEANSLICASVEAEDIYCCDRQFVLFIDYGLYDVKKLTPCSKNGITGIRYAFTRANYLEHKEQIIQEMSYIQDMGYSLFMQDVYTNGYSEKELKEIIDIANEIRPKAFGIVDTYGSMYLDDLEEKWSFINKYLAKDISIDFHSHNNMQMSFAMAQRLINLAENSRKLIIDSSLNGMGKGAGNLNTELIVDYLVRKKDYLYDVDCVLDAIDRYIENIKNDVDWGYSIPYFMAGIYNAHPNNIIFLTEKYRLNSRDIKYIVSAISDEKRKRYDYDNIQKVYQEYCNSKINDEQTIKQLKSFFHDKEVLVLATGKSVCDYEEKIKRFLEKTECIVVAINLPPKNINIDYMFFANTIHWEKLYDTLNHEKCIITSNIRKTDKKVLTVEYSKLVFEGENYGDNSTIMLLNLLKTLEVKKIYIAGFDGFREQDENYIKEAMPRINKDTNYALVNQKIADMVRRIRQQLEGKIDITFLTPSLYDKG